MARLFLVRAIDVAADAPALRVDTRKLEQTAALNHRDRWSQDDTAPPRDRDSRTTTAAALTDKATSPTPTPARTDRGCVRRGDRRPCPSAGAAPLRSPRRHCCAGLALPPRAPPKPAISPAASVRGASWLVAGFRRAAPLSPPGPRLPAFPPPWLPSVGLWHVPVLTHHGPRSGTLRSAGGRPAAIAAGPLTVQPKAAARAPPAAWAPHAA